MSIKYEPGSFITIPNKEYLNELTSTEIVAYMWICSYANKQGICYPSRVTIAKHIKSTESKSGHMTTMTIDKAIKVLVKKGFLLVKNRKTVKGKRTSNLYQLMLLTQKIK